jgi:hypothetical protein
VEFDWGKGDVIVVDGTEVGHASRSWLRERAEVQIGPELWDYRSTGWSSSELTASLDRATHFVARRSGFLTSTWTIDAAERMQLRHGGFFSTRLVLSRDGAPLGEVTRSGLFTTRPRLTVGEPMDPRLGCFLLWVAHVELSRQSSDGGGGAAAAAT